LTVERIELDAAVAMIVAGEIIDAKTIVGCLLASRLLAARDGAPGPPAVTPAAPATTGAPGSPAATGATAVPAATAGPAGPSATTGPTGPSAAD
jgi:hypothetical protein